MKLMVKRPLSIIYMMAAFSQKSKCYTGSLYGVRVHVALHELPNEQGHAEIKLQGIPVGGVLQGNATFDKENNILMDSSLRRALAFRRVSLCSVTRDTQNNTLRVTVRLPIFGQQSVTLTSN